MLEVQHGSGLNISYLYCSLHCILQSKKIVMDFNPHIKQNLFIKDRRYDARGQLTP